MLLVDEVPYYNENVLKLILGHYGIKYQYEKDKVYIGEIIETDKLPLSEAEIYEIGAAASENSGIRSDKNGNEFSGILITEETFDGGYVSYFVNENYNRMSGVIHVTKETPNRNSAEINIVVIDRDGNETTVYTSEEITNLSHPVPFKDINIDGAVIVSIQQDVFYAEVEAVISDAFFYNE